MASSSEGRFCPCRGRDETERSQASNELFGRNLVASRNRLRGVISAISRPISVARSRLFSFLFSLEPTNQTNNQLSIDQAARESMVVMNAGLSRLRIGGGQLDSVQRGP
jgi:hypothetical protein